MNKVISGFDCKIDRWLILVCVLGSLLGIFTTGCSTLPQLANPGWQYLAVHASSEVLDLYKYNDLKK